MDGSPQLLTDVKFTQLRKGGYDPEEVDNYLERINDAVAKLAEKLRTATEQSESAQAQLAEARRAQSTAEAEVERLSGGDAPVSVPVGGDEELAKVLVLAQRAADQAIEEANANATRTVADARAKAVNLLAEAEQERERLLVKAHKKADAAAEERARHLAEQVDALAAARADLEADVEALRAHLDGERDRLRQRIDSVRAALDDPDGLRLAPTPELHETPVPVVDLPGLDGTDPADEAEAPTDELAVDPPADEAEAPTDEPEAVAETVVIESVVVETGIEEPTAEPAPPEPRLAPLPAPGVEGATEPAAAPGALTETMAMPAIVPLPDAPVDPQSSVAHPELVPLVDPEPEPADPGADDTIYLDAPPPPPADTKQVEAQLFAGDPVAENRAAIDPSSRPPSDLFARDEDSPLGEPDEEADAAMKAFFERDLDDPTIAGRGRFGRRR